MSRHKFFPIYVARSLNSGCGHQHATEAKAHNCAFNMLKHHPALDQVTVIKVRRNAVSLATIETISEVIKQQTPGTKEA